MDYIDLTSAAWSIAHSCNLSTFLSSVDNNVDGCLIFNMQEGGNVATDPPRAKPLSFSCVLLLLTWQDVLSHLATQLPLNSYRGPFLSKDTHTHSGQVHIRTFKTGQMVRNTLAHLLNLSKAALLDSPQMLAAKRQISSVIYFSQRKQLLVMNCLWWDVFQPHSLFFGKRRSVISGAWSSFSA